MMLINSTCDSVTAIILSVKGSRCSGFENEIAKIINVPVVINNSSANLFQSSISSNIKGKNTEPT